MSNVVAKAHVVAFIGLNEHSPSAGLAHFNLAWGHNGLGIIGY